MVQGALKLILEPIFEADFQPGSYGYRPKRTAHQAVIRVAQAIVSRKTRVIDLDLRAYFDNVRHDQLLAKVARRIQDATVMRLLKQMLKSTGKKGVPQGGVISPLLSNLYLNEVDRMLEKAIATTRFGQYTRVQYARFADDMVLLIDSHPRQDWLVKAVAKTSPGGISQTQSGDQRREEPDGRPIEGRELLLPGIRVPPYPKPIRKVVAPVCAQAEKADGTVEQSSRPSSDDTSANLWNG